MFAERSISPGARPAIKLQPTIATAKRDLPQNREADPECAQAVADLLLSYLRRRLRLPALSYSAVPTPVSNGWEAFIYAFRLQADGLPEPWGRPLLLRIHASRRGLARARHEFEVQRYLVRDGYP